MVLYVKKEERNETGYIERSHVSNTPFSIHIGFGDIRGWRGESKILENTKWRDGDETWECLCDTPPPPQTKILDMALQSSFPKHLKVFKVMVEIP